MPAAGETDANGMAPLTPASEVSGAFGVPETNASQMPLPSHLSLRLDLSDRHNWPAGQWRAVDANDAANRPRIGEALILGTTWPSVSGGAHFVMEQSTGGRLYSYLCQVKATDRWDVSEGDWTSQAAG